MRGGIASSVLLLALGASGLTAQLLRPKAPMPSFEVATVKPWKPVVMSSPQKVTKVAPAGAVASVTDRVHFIGQIELLIESAYGLPFSSSNRILGGPDWIRNESDRYEVIATIDTLHFAAIERMTLAEQQQQVSWMEQSLLADRFQLKTHIETRDMPEYALVLAKGGMKLESAAGDAKSQMSFVRNGQENEIKATAVSLEELARSPFLRMDKRQIVDHTGVDGRFNFTLKFSVNAPDSDLPELPTALQEQLNLRLIPENGPVEVVVIDHIERPSGN